MYVQSQQLKHLFKVLHTLQMTDVKVSNAKKTLQMANVGKYFRHTYLMLFLVTTFKINLCVGALLSNAHVSSIHGAVTKKDHYVKHLCRV